MISFDSLKSLFDTTWDVGYLSADGLLQCAYSPIKHKWNYVGEDFTNGIRFGPTNAIVLIKQGHTWDYTLYNEAEKIMQVSGIHGWHAVYTNYKEAAILSGLGVRAKNSLIYSYKFGFDCHITVIRFDEEIVDIPTNKRVNTQMWSRCEGCDDCAKACPVGAIHNEKEPFWLDSAKCQDFCGTGMHPTIPSVATFLIKNVWEEGVPQGFQEDKPETFIKGRGYSYEKGITWHDGKPVNIPFCRECTSQPRCSKWGGKYPYEDIK